MMEINPKSATAGQTDLRNGRAGLEEYGVQVGTARCAFANKYRYFSVIIFLACS